MQYKPMKAAQELLRRKEANILDFLQELYDRPGSGMFDGFIRNHNIARVITGSLLPTNNEDDPNDILSRLLNPDSVRLFLFMSRGEMLLGMMLAVIYFSEGRLPLGLIKGALVAINREFGVRLSV